MINRGFEGGFGGSRSFHEQPAPRDSEPDAVRAKAQADRMKQGEIALGLEGNVEKHENLVYKYNKFPLGVGSLKSGEKLPVIAKEKGYKSVGEVNRKPFSKKLRSKNWYADKAKYAASLVSKFDKVAFFFPSFKNAAQKAKIKGIISDIATFGDRSPATFKKDLETTYTSDELYGAEGAFNVILAYKRACAPGSLEDKDNVDIAVKLSSNRSVSVYEKVASAAPAKAEGAKEKVKEAAGRDMKLVNDYNKFMEEAEKEAQSLYDQIDDAEKNGMQKDQAEKLRNILRGTKFDRVPISRDPDEADFKRYEEASMYIDVVKKGLPGVHVKLTPPAADLPGGVTPTKAGAKPTAGPGATGLPGKPTETGADKNGKSYDQREKEERVKVALQRGNVKEYYDWKDDHSVMAKQIAKEVLAACDPATDMSSILVTLEGMALAKIREAAKTRGKDEKQFRLDDDTKINMVDLVLTNMKNFGIKRRTEY